MLAGGVAGVGGVGGADAVRLPDVHLHAAGAVVSGPAVPVHSAPVIAVRLPVDPLQVVWTLGVTIT